MSQKNSSQFKWLLMWNEKLTGVNFYYSDSENMLLWYTMTYKWFLTSWLKERHDGFVLGHCSFGYLFDAFRQRPHFVRGEMYCIWYNRYVRLLTFVSFIILCNTVQVYLKSLKQNFLYLKIWWFTNLEREFCSVSFIPFVTF